jgi:tetratricopeptide (TPR) repeat protein
MKKVLLVSLVVLFSVLLLNAQHGKNDQKDPFSVYRADQSKENFIKAINFYSKESENNDSNKIMKSYTLLTELNKNIDELKDNLKELDNSTKFSLANLLLSLKRYEESIEIYDVLNSESPKWSCPWRHKGEAYFKNNELEKAEKALNSAIETRVEHYDAYVMLADVQNDMGKPKEALKTLETGLSYLGKDIEEADKEVADLDVKFLHLELLKLNKKNKEYKKLKLKLEKIAPDDKRWEEIGN